MLSLRETLANLPVEQRRRVVDRLPDEVADVLTTLPWWFVARPEQQTPPDQWHVWLILAGRGWGKTRTGAEWIIEEVLSQPTAPDGSSTEWALIAETFGDTRSICVEGPSGILRVMEQRGMRRGVHYSYNRSSWQIGFATGQRLHMLGADNPDAGRGFNFAGVWADEVAKWRYPYDTWMEGIAPALRIGVNPRAVVTTTPKPNRLLKDWTSRDDGSVVVTRGSTFDNAANLSPTALAELKARYAGTRLGRQELYGELLDEAEGALWSHSLFDRHRVDEIPEPVIRRVVGVDPAVSQADDSSETGIIVVAQGESGTCYVEADHSGRYAPNVWAAKVAALDVDSVIAEVNQGGDMVHQVLVAAGVSTRIRAATAQKGKKARAEPVAVLYEQGKVVHVGTHAGLEDQAATWVPGEGRSPDRIDALVWAVAGLIQSPTAPLPVVALGRQQVNEWAL